MIKEKYHHQVNAFYKGKRKYTIEAIEYLIKEDENERILEYKEVKRYSQDFFEPIILKKHRNYNKQIITIAEEFLVNDYCVDFLDVFVALQHAAKKAERWFPSSISHYN
jgi:hypothetical protein